MSEYLEEENVEKVYQKLGYQSQSDFFDTRLPIYNDFLSFEEYQKQLQSKEEPVEIVEDLADTEIKFTEDIIEFDYNPNMFYANLAKDSYKPVSKRKNFLNYKYLEDESSENLATYINDEKKELSFAIPGTSKLGDFTMDTNIAFGSIGNPLLSLDGRYAEIDNKIKEVKNKYNDYSVSVSGHSAGGSLANYLGIDNPDYAVNTYNMAQGLPFLTNNIKCFLGNCDNINNFRIVGDWASSMSTMMTQGKVFNMKPIIPTEEMNLQADAQETFYYPSYMGLPHNINQFINRNESKLLPDYGQYGRKLAGSLGGLTTAVALPTVTKKLGKIVDTKISEQVRISEENPLPYPGFQQILTGNFIPNILDDINELNIFDDALPLPMPQSLRSSVIDYTTQNIRERIIERLPETSYLPSIKSKLDYITSTNDVVSGLAGFGLGELAGTVLYESALKPDITPLKKKFVTQTEITDLDEDRYFTNIPASIIGGAGITGMYLGGIGYFMQNHLGNQIEEAD